MRAFPLLFALTLWLTGCDQNLFHALVDAENDRSRLEQARIEIDEQEYEKALATLALVERDSNELRLLRSSAQLGAVGLSLWDILFTIIDGDGFDQGQASGIDNFFNQVSEGLLGEGETKQRRLAALTSSMLDLNSAPDRSQSRVKNLSCFLAGLIAIPTSSEATLAIQNINSTLSALAASTDISNPQAQCPDLTSFDSNINTLAQVRQQLSLILDSSQDCKILDLSSSGGDLNAIEAQIQKINTGADKGCTSSPSCGSSAACQALGLECIYSALTAGETPALANDQSLAKCEIVQNCLNPGSCF